MRSSLRYNIDSAISCPVDLVNEVGFATASQYEGACSCLVDVYWPGMIPPVQTLGQSPARGSDAVTDGPNVPIQKDNCQCRVCPSNTAFRYAMSCETDIIGNCKSFNCDGMCNAPLDLLTFSPTSSPTSAPSSSPTLAPSGLPSMQAEVVASTSAPTSETFMPDTTTVPTLGQRAAESNSMPSLSDAGVTMTFTSTSTAISSILALLVFWL